MKVLVVALSLFVLSTETAKGEVYQWVDDSGVIGFTDNKDLIPPQYRNRARTRNIFIPPPSRMTPPPPERSSAPGGRIDDTSDMIGGYNMAGWQAQFRSLRTEIATTSVRITENRNKLNLLHRKRVTYQRAADRVAYNELLAVISQDEANLKQFQARIAALEAEADRMGVPIEWRQ